MTASSFSRLVLGLSPFALSTFLSSAALAQTPDPAPAPVAPPPAPASAPPSAPPPPPLAHSDSAAAPPAAPRPANAQSIVELTSLRLMREKGIISQAEYDSALTDIIASTGYRGPDAVSLAVGKWSTTIYGFAETDLINDSTGSFNDVAGNTLVLRPNGVPPLLASQQNNYAANHGKTQMSVRNSRLGIQLRAPETHGVRVSGLLETDFEGYLPAPSATSGTSQSQFFSSPTMRVRHAYLKIETPIVDLLVGQYWDLFGWQNFYHPNTVEIQGIPSELYSRDAQIRVSHAFKTQPIEVEVAVAARRPPSADSQVPDFQGGLRFSFPWWRGVTTTGATGTSVMPASLAVTGDFREFALPEYSNLPTRTVKLTTEAIAVDAFIPVIPQKSVKSGNALSINGEFVTGGGISDLYTGLSMGMTFPTYIAPVGAVQGIPTSYVQDVDNGMVVYDTTGNLHAINLTTFLVGLQYYLPGLAGHVWLSGNVARTMSNNVGDFTRADSVLAPTVPTGNNLGYYPLAATVRNAETFFDVNLFWDIISGARVGLEYANFNDQYVDGAHAINNRFQFSGFFIF